MNDLETRALSETDPVQRAVYADKDAHWTLIAECFINALDALTGEKT